MDLTLSIRNRLSDQYDQVDDLLKTVSPAFLEQRHLPKKWSVSEHLAHLGRYHEIFVERIEQILQQSAPRFARYVADLDKGFSRWLALDVPTIIQESKDKRREVSDLIFSLDATQLARIGYHPKLGALDIPTWSTFFLLHEQHHFYSIFWLIQGYQTK